MVEPAWLTQHQTLIAAGAAFIAAMITIFMNAYLNRRQRDRERLHQTNVMRRALFAELSAQRDRLGVTMEHVEAADRDENTVSFQLGIAAYTDVFEASLENLGLLSVDEVSAVIKAYARVRLQRPFAAFIGRRTVEPGGDEVFEIPKDRLVDLMVSFRVLQQDLNDAIAEIRNQQSVLGVI